MKTNDNPLPISLFLSLSLSLCTHSPSNLFKKFKFRKMNVGSETRGFSPWILLSKYVALNYTKYIVLYKRYLSTIYTFIFYFVSLLNYVLDLFSYMYIHTKFAFFFFTLLFFSFFLTLSYFIVLVFCFFIVLLWYNIFSYFIYNVHCPKRWRGYVPGRS